MSVDLTNRITGSIIGLAIGDALGSTVEGAKPGSIKSAYKRVVDYVDPEEWVGREKIYKWRKPGLYTDDTQQALALLDSLLQDRGLNQDKAAARLADLARGAEFYFGVYRGAGKNFRHTITDIRQGKAWAASGRDSAGNGAAMRIAPVAIYYRSDLEAMAEKVAEASLITHRNPVGISAAFAVSYLIARCLEIEELESPDQAVLIRDAADYCFTKEQMLATNYKFELIPGYEKSLNLFSDALKNLADHFSESAKNVAERIVAFAAPHSETPVTRPTHGFAPASVVFAIYIAISKSGSFEDMVLTAVNEGGDADTVAAIAGSISGALLGADEIPERLLKGLANRKQIKARAEALAARKWMHGKLEDLYEMEYGLTRREHEERLARMKKLGVDFPEKKKFAKMADPAPVSGKFDRKKQRRDAQRLKQWEIFYPDSPEND
ncbi:MAG: ADP-ribosylglycohydrolase family protein [bacterium]